MLKYTLTQPAPSPCIQLCKIDVASGWCVGCYRTLEEISHWSTKTTAEQYAVLAVLNDRANTVFPIDTAIP